MKARQTSLPRSHARTPSWLGKAGGPLVPGDGGRRPEGYRRPAAGQALSPALRAGKEEQPPEKKKAEKGTCKLCESWRKCPAGELRSPCNSV